MSTTTGCLRFTLLLAVAAAGTGPLQASAEPLGRLFFTPERRAQLERQRQYNIQETRTLQGGSMRLDGIVQRSSGRSTIWVNGVPQNERSDSAGVAAKLPQHGANKAELSTGDEPAAELRVGEAINRGTRETSDLLGGGIVRRSPPATGR
jgi:hypothetical protein